MFFEGDLQSGISSAIAQQKLVACFVTDESEESSEWESLLLQDSEVCAELRRPCLSSNFSSSSPSSMPRQYYSV